jgi:hypothetical protein
MVDVAGAVVGVAAMVDVAGAVVGVAALVDVAGAVVGVAASVDVAGAVVGVAALVGVAGAVVGVAATSPIIRIASIFADAPLACTNTTVCVFAEKSGLVHVFCDTRSLLASLIVPTSMPSTTTFSEP